MAADSYANIRQYATSLYNLMLERGQGISSSSPQDETMVIYVDKKDIQSLLSVTDCQKIAFVIGQENNKATIGLLCADGQNNILPAHVEGTLDGQEVWDEFAQGQNLDTVLPPAK